MGVLNKNGVLNMQSVLNEISKLRKESSITVDFHNSNRYRLVFLEKDGSKTAYYFSAPIYNDKTRKIVDVKFKSEDDLIYMNGSNASITVSTNILMEKSDGTCEIELPQKASYISDRELCSGNVTILPTTNGVALKCDVTEKQCIEFLVNVSKSFLNMRANDRFFALMKEQFKPFVVFSSIGSLDENYNVISPAKIEYQKLTDKKYKVTILPTSPFAKYVLFEANLYENKLFQDTTVESKNPLTNNAFGSVGFIGNSSFYGEQWLYSRLDYSKISDIFDKRISKVILHIPRLNQSDVELYGFAVAARFCSFGSTWQNKIREKPEFATSLLNDGYQSMDITSLFVEQRTRTISKTEGIILKSKTKCDYFSVITTGDSSLVPQILEVNFR